MKRLFFTFFAVMAMLFTAHAQTPIYAIFGDNPVGMSDDLRSAVNVPNVTDGVLVISGTQHSSHICQNAGTSIEIKPSVGFSMNLTSDFAIHMKIKKAEGTNSDVQLSFCQNGWNACRAGFLIATASLPTDEFEEVIIKYSDKQEISGGQYYCEKPENLLGGKTWNANADFLRIAAANGETIYISQIYIEAEYVALLTPQDPKRYYFVRGGDLPVIAGVECVDLRAPTYSAWSATSGTLDVSDGTLKYTAPNSWFTVNFMPKSQCMADVSKADWHLRMKFKTNATNIEPTRLKIGLKDGGANFFLNNSYADEEWHDVVFALNDASGTLPSFPIAANQRAFQLFSDGGTIGEGKYFNIEYAYLTNDPLTDEKPVIADNVAPANFTVTEKTGATNHNSTMLRLYAEDDDTPITYNISYKVKGSSDEPVVTSASGAQSTTIEKVITGLSSETTYTFSVVASDPNGNETSAQEIDITTTSFVEKRYYIFRSGDLPDNTAALACVDLRPGTGASIEYTNGSSSVAGDYFNKFHMSPSGNWGHITAIPTSDALSDVDDSWYLCIRYKSQHPGAVYANVACHDRTDYTLVAAHTDDNEWKTVQVQLNTWSNKTLPVVGSNSSHIGLLQLKTNNDAIANPGDVSIDYAYITNGTMYGIDPGYQDNTAPSVSVSHTATTATTITLHIEGADDSDSKIYYTISDGTNNYNVEKNSGEVFDYEISGLAKGTGYTITIDARDPFNNPITQWSQAITTDGDVVAPEMAYVNKGIVTPNSIELLLKATDNQEGTLNYTISVGGNEYHTTGDAGVEVAYKVTDLSLGTEYSFSVTATDAGENESEPMQASYSTLSLKASDFATYAAIVNIYPEGTNKKANVEAAPKGSLGIYVVVHNNKFLFKEVAQGEGASLSTGPWDYQLRTWNEELTSSADKIADKWTTDQITRYMSTAADVSTLADVFPFNCYANNIFGIAGANFTDMYYFYKGYVNVPSEDNTAPSIASVGYEQEGSDIVITINGVSEDAFFYVVSENGTEYLSMVNTVTVPASAIEDGNRTFTCYAIDWNANISTPKEVAILSQISLDEAVDNSTTISDNDGNQVNVQLTRTLTNASFNTFCVPFDMSAAQVIDVFGEGTRIGKLADARLKEGDELYLNFAFVNAIEAGVPYIIQPANTVTDPLIYNVQIEAGEHPTVVSGVITFNGIFSPKEISRQSAESHTILLLGAENVLSWPNRTADMKGMRAYFETTSSVARIARKAHFGFEEEQVATGLGDVQGNEVQCTKLLRDGQLYILHNGIMYNVQGVRVQ